MLEESYQAAIRIMKSASKSFYAAFKHLPQERFYAVAAVYAFCRWADDSVDEASNDREAEENISHLEAYIIGENQINEDWQAAFEDSRRRFQISNQAFLNQCHGQRLDLGFSAMQSRDDLINYCRYVAGSVGEMLGPILIAEDYDNQDPKFHQAVIDLGIGMQLTNILRDVGEDLAKLNRIYLPKDLLSDYDLDAVSLRKMQNNPKQISSNYQALIEEIMSWSSDYYATIEENSHYFHPNCRLAVLASARIYHAIEDEIRQHGYNNLSRRNYTSKLKRLQIISQLKSELNES